jgi:hypothetical protein
MYLKPTDLILKTNTLTMVHGENELVWNMSVYRNSLDEDNGLMLCKHINQYWSTLSYDHQQYIFDLYVAIKDKLDNNNNLNIGKLIVDLLPMIDNLLSFHKLDDLLRWVTWNNEIIINGDKFSDTYINDDMKPGNRIKTYTKSDYRELISLSMRLRVMLPIWGEYISSCKKGIGTKYKEYEAYSLLEGSDIHLDPPMEKLRLYVESNIPDKVDMSSAILDGIGSDEYSKWITASVIVSKLSVGDFTGSDPDIHLVTFIYNFIYQKIIKNKSPVFGSNPVNIKKYKEDDSVSDNNSSRTEAYKIKQDISIGDIAIIESYMNNHHRVMSKIDPSVPASLIDNSIYSSSTLMNQSIGLGQITLAKWVLSINKVIPPRSMQLFTKYNVVKCLGLAQAWLLHNGHDKLACLVTSYISVNDNNTLQLGGIDSRARITQEQMNELNVLFPYTYCKSIKQKTKPTNDAVVSIDLVSGWLSQGDLILTISKDIRTEVTKRDNNRYTCPHDIKQLLANLIINIKKINN